MSNYSQDFYSSIRGDSFEAAKLVVPILRSLVSPRSVLDVGCGDGTWLSHWGSSLLKVGVESETSDTALVSHDIHVLRCDLNRGLPEDILNKRFDIVTCFEVAEHLSPDAADKLIVDLCRVSDVVCFSAATPGQGGVDHINERPFSHWHNLFNRQGFRMYDYIRPKVIESKIAPWYKYNIFLYLKENAQVGSDLSAYLIRDSRDIPQIEPFFYRVRKMLIGVLPINVVTKIALLKHRIRK